MTALAQDVEIRRARRADAAAWRSAVEVLLGAHPSHAEFDDALAANACYALLALAANEPVGLLGAYRLPGLTTQGPLVYLYDIAVLANRRNQGIGHALIATLLGACRDDGVRLVWAGTAGDNAAARALFATTGAIALGERFVEYEWRLARPSSLPAEATPDV